MRLRPEEKNIEKQQATTAVVVFLLPLIALIYFSTKYFKEQTEILDEKEAQAQIAFDKNEIDIEEIRILQGNQSEINSTWDLLNNWNQGAINQESIQILTQAGFEEVTPVFATGPGRLPTRSTPRGQNNNSVTTPNRDYNQIVGYSQKTEYLRLLDALINIEKEEGLTQIQRAYISLPPNTPPYAGRATYLDIDLVLATPTAIR